MRIESIRLKNFRAFRDVHMRDIPAFCVLIGANGAGKSTLFSVFSFLRDAMTTNVTAALGRLGGSRGIQEVRSRDCEGPIEIELKIRADIGRPQQSLITYSLTLAEQEGRPVVEREVLKYRRGSSGQPWHFIDFSRGTGSAVTNELDSDLDEAQLKRETQTLKSPDILAIKGLAQFERFPAAVALGTLIENWHLSDFHISRARPEQEAGYAEHLSREGENLSLVIEYLHKQHLEVFTEILKKLASRVPGITSVESKVTEEGRVLLKFQDGSFQDPFLARYVSDGTIKMLAYLVLLLDPKPHPLLCVEEPENQLYPALLSDLAEEFRSYAIRGGQVFVSTHSPDFLNAIETDEAFWLVKNGGYTEVRRAKDDAQITAYMNDGDKLGYLWKQGLFDGADPAVNLVFMLEEPSAKDLLQGLLPRLVPASTTVHYLTFEGKQDLERQLVKKLRGWRLPASAFVVLRDQDAAECRAVKTRLSSLVAESGRTPTLVRVACRELEAWVVGDWHAVAQAFGRPQLVAQSSKENYRNPDQLVRPVESLRKFIPDYQKRDGARRVGGLLDPLRNSSASFRAFCTGVQRLLA